MYQNRVPVSVMFDRSANFIIYQVLTLENIPEHKAVGWHIVDK
jgi:hypothetical protein